MIAYVRPKSRDFSQDYKSCVVELVAAGGKSDDAVALSRVNGTAEQGAFLCCCEPLDELFTRNETGIPGIVLNASHISGEELRSIALIRRYKLSSGVSVIKCLFFIPHQIL